MTIRRSDVGGWLLGAGQDVGEHGRVDVAAARDGHGAPDRAATVRTETPPPTPRRWLDNEARNCSASALTASTISSSSTVTTSSTPSALMCSHGSSPTVGVRRPWRSVRPPVDVQPMWVFRRKPSAASPASAGWTPTTWVCGESVLIATAVPEIRQKSGPARGRSGPPSSASSSPISALAGDHVTVLNGGTEGASPSRSASSAAVVARSAVWDPHDLGTG